MNISRFEVGEKVSQNRINGMVDAINANGKTPIVDKTTDAGTEYTLDPNQLYVFGQKTTLNIGLNPPEDSSIVNEYMFQFVSGTTATTLSVPNTVTWAKTPSIQTSKTYQVSILNNLAVIGEF